MIALRSSRVLTSTHFTTAVTIATGSKQMQLFLRNTAQEGGEYDDNDATPIGDDDFDKAFNKRFANMETKKSALFSGKGKWQVINKAILAGMFIAGIGTGK